MGENDESPDFYINVCEPLTPIQGVSCPAGAAVCMDPDNGPPVVRKLEYDIHQNAKKFSTQTQSVTDRL